MVGDVLNVMKELAEQGMTMIIVTSRNGDLPVRLLTVSSLLQTVSSPEDGTPDQIFDNPQHPRLKEFLDKVLNA